jgi:undecaprenyl-diphosphatase
MSKETHKAAEALLEIDRQAHEAVRPFEDTNAVKALSWFSELGDQPQMLTLSGGVLALGVISGNRCLVRAGGRMIASHLLATGVKNFIKQRVDRTRPRNRTAKRDHEPTLGRDDSKEETSFPSGHSAGALAVAQAFARELPEYRAAAVTGAGLIAIAQVPRCAHYPTDVGVGLAIGWASELAVDRAARLLGWSVGADTES